MDVLIPDFLPYSQWAVIDKGGECSGRRSFLLGFSRKVTLKKLVDYINLLGAKQKVNAEIEC